MTQGKQNEREPGSDADFFLRLKSIPDMPHGGRPDKSTFRKTEKAEEELDRERQDREHKELVRAEKLAKKKSHRENKEADRCLARAMRRSYAQRAYWYLVLYSVTCLLLLLADGSPSCPLNLPDSIMLALIGTTAVSVLGLVGIILTGLFSKKN